MYPVPYLEREQRDTHFASDGQQARIVARQRYVLSPCSQELDCRDVQSIQRPHGHRERLESSYKNGRRKLEESNALQEFARVLSM